MTKEETVAYLMGDETREASFKYDYPHLYYRICRLREAMIGYYVEEDIRTLVSSEFNANGLPYISEAEFSASKGRRYCERMERYFAKIPKNNAVLPRPQFAVTVTVEYGEGAFERYVYDFRRDSEENLTEFCKRIRDKGLYYYRLRTKERYRKIIGLT